MHQGDPDYQTCRAAVDGRFSAWLGKLGEINIVIDVSNRAFDCSVIRKMAANGM